ncbi:MAG: monomethylamine:corrinoid methyltransferase [Chloroflexi bacterium]|nr:monomethylamine:corrinoid methyltransferase [Chloroflexota bacterium]
MENILRLMDKVTSGPICTLKEWDTKVLPGALRDKLEQYDLSGACDPENPITSDDDLAAKFSKAGYELAHETGMRCQDTERRVLFSEEELKQSLRNAPSKIELGSGPDRVDLVTRRPEDPTEPLFQGPLAIEISEDVWIPMVTGIAMNRVIDVLEPPSMITIYGRRVLAGTPLETLLGAVEVEWRDEALRRAGRPGMPTVGIMGSTTYHGQLGGFNVQGLPRTDIALVLSPFELKTTYHALHKAVQAKASGALIRGGTPSIIGGYAGPAEGAVVANIAATPLQFPVHLADYAAGSMMDLRYNANTGREGTWALSMSTQALSRNTDLIISKLCENVCGPMTDLMLYEQAVGMITMTVAGASATTGARSAGGNIQDHLTPLECWFSAEVFKAAAGMRRKQANEIVNKLIRKYEDILLDPPKGKTFQELYDVETLTPIPEWQEMVDRVKSELVDMGLPLDL